jgi:hypothetical protein
MHNAKTDSSVGLDPLIKGMRDWKLHILFEQFWGRVVFELYLLAHVGSKHYTLAKYAKIKIIRTPFILLCIFGKFVIIIIKYLDLLNIINACLAIRFSQIRFHNFMDSSLNSSTLNCNDNSINYNIFSKLHYAIFLNSLEVILRIWNISDMLLSSNSIYYRASKLFF